MKRIMFVLLVALLVPLVFGQTPCPEQPFHDPATFPVTLDQAQIAVDPNTGQKCLLSAVPVYVHPGQAWTIRGSICDPDSDQMTLTASAGALVIHADNTYTLTGTCLALGPIYVTMTLVDKPLIPSESIMRRGTWVVVGVPRNKAPRLCGGLP